MIRDPSSPSHKPWILGVVRFDPCSVVANTLSIRPWEYVRKNETQKELTGSAQALCVCGGGALCPFLMQDEI